MRKRKQTRVAERTKMTRRDGQIRFVSSQKREREREEKRTSSSASPFGRELLPFLPRRRSLKRSVAEEHSVCALTARVLAGTRKYVIHLHTSHVPRAAAEATRASPIYMSRLLAPALCLLTYVILALRRSRQRGVKTHPRHLTAKCQRSRLLVTSRSRESRHSSRIHPSSSSAELSRAAMFTSN